MRGFLIFLGLVLSFASSAQVSRLFMNDNIDRVNTQVALKAWDSEAHLPLRSSLHRLPSDSLRYAHHWNNGHILPVGALDAQLRYNDSLQFSSSTIAGVGLHQRFRDKLFFDGAIFGGFLQNPTFPDRLTRASEVATQLGSMQNAGGKGYTFWEGVFSLRYRPSAIFELEAGRAKQFIGEGYRSLMLSDHAAPYPFAKLSTQIWKFRYVNLFTAQSGVFDPFRSPRDWERKHTATHVLSVNVGESTNISLFETIIWQAQDSLSDRGFDVHYLNPIIFYRPVEFSRGSADNAIIGLAISQRVWPNMAFYGQLVFDEFLLQEFRNRTGWWGNKFGVQLGWKGHDVLNIEGLYTQVEWNLVRPFTYSHGSPLQSYTHRNEALAHPLGANFSEWTGILFYRRGDWEWRWQGNYLIKGEDEGFRNQGGDIFRSYADPFSNFDNRIGQGIRIEGWSSHLQLARILDAESDTRIQIGYGFDYRGGEAAITRDHVFTLSLRSSFIDGYR